MFVEVSNVQPLGICARVGMATVLAYAKVTHHGIYLQSLYGIRPCIQYDFCTQEFYI